MRQRDQPFDMVLLSDKRDMLIYLQFAREMFGRSAVRAVADHQQVRRGALQGFGEDADAIEGPLDGPEIRQVDQQLLALRRIRSRAFFRVVGMVELSIDEIVDDETLVRE